MRNQDKVLIYIAGLSENGGLPSDRMIAQHVKMHRCDLARCLDNLRKDGLIRARPWSAGGNCGEGSGVSIYWLSPMAARRMKHFRRAA